MLGNANASTTTNSVVEVAVGTNMNGTVTTQRFLMLGISESSMLNLTPTATQLIENSVYYILSLDIPRKTYTFTGNGNWDEASNWMNNQMPPANLPAGNQIIIDPIITGECVLNVQQAINSGASIIVKSNKNFRILSNVEIQ